MGISASKAPRTSQSSRRASVIIAAYNEEATIVPVIHTAEQHPLVKEVIVVSDGSTDATAKLARRTSAQVIAFKKNRGKGEALAAGIHRASGEVLTFLDADVLGLQPHMLTKLIRPVLTGHATMTTLIRERNGRFSRLIAQLIPLGGERTLLRKLWNRVPADERKGFGVELALNHYATQTCHPIQTIPARGLTQVIKERKRGVLRGLAQRVGMVWSCVRAWWLLHRKITKTPSA